MLRIFRGTLTLNVINSYEIHYQSLKCHISKWLKQNKIKLHSNILSWMEGKKKAVSGTEYLSVSQVNIT